METGKLSLDRGNQLYKDCTVEAFLIQQIKNYEPGSEFEKMALHLINNEVESKWLDFLLKHHYDVFYGIDESKKQVIGFFAYQRHDDEWHVFRFQIEKEYRGSRYSVELAGMLCLRAPDSGVWKIKIGKSGDETDQTNEASVRLLTELKGNSKWPVNLEKHLIMIL